MGLYGYLPFRFLISIFKNSFILDCFAEHLLFESTLSRMSEDGNEFRKVKERKMSKKRQNEVVKRNKILLREKK